MKSKVIAYEMVGEDSLNYFNEKCKRLIERGFVPYGLPVLRTSCTRMTHYKMFAQAFVKREIT